MMNNSFTIAFFIITTIFAYQNVAFLKNVGFHVLDPWLVQERPAGIGCLNVPRAEVSGALIQAVQRKDSACVYDLLYDTADLETSEMEPAIQEAILVGDYGIFYSLVLRCTSKPACRLETSKLDETAKRACLMSAPISYETFIHALYEADRTSFRNLLEHVSLIDRKNMFRHYLPPLLNRILDIPQDSYVKELPGKLLACLYDVRLNLTTTRRPRSSLQALYYESLGYLRSALVSYPLEEILLAYRSSDGFSQSLKEAHMEMMRLGQLDKVKAIRKHFRYNFADLLGTCFSMHPYNIFEYVLSELKKDSTEKQYLSNLFYKQFEGTIPDLPLKMELILKYFSENGIMISYKTLEFCAEKSRREVYIPALRDMMAKHAVGFDSEMIIKHYLRSSIIDERDAACMDEFIRHVGPNSISKDLFRDFTEHSFRSDNQSGCNFLGVLIKNRCPMSLESFLSAIDIDRPDLFSSLIVSYPQLAEALNDEGAWRSEAHWFIFWLRIQNLAAVGKNLRILCGHGYKITELAGYIAANQIKVNIEPTKVLQILSTIHPLNIGYLNHAKESLDYFRGQLDSQKLSLLPEIKKLIENICNFLVVPLDSAESTELSEELVNIITGIVLKLYEQQQNIG